MHKSDVQLAALYGADCLTEREEANFVRKLAVEPKLIMHTIAQAPELPEPIMQPSEAVRESLFNRVFPPEKAESFLQTLEDRNAQALVVADPQGIVEWVSPAFTRMCGFTLAELQGNKAGKMLQGAETEASSVEPLRVGIREGRAAKTQVINYHKSGSRYEVDIQLEPLRGSAGELVGFVAVETEL